MFATDPIVGVGFTHSLPINHVSHFFSNWYYYLIFEQQVGEAVCGVDTKEAQNCRCVIAFVFSVLAG